MALSVGDVSPSSEARDGPESRAKQHRAQERMKHSPRISESSSLSGYRKFRLLPSRGRYKPDRGGSAELPPDSARLSIPSARAGSGDRLFSLAGRLVLIGRLVLVCGLVL